MCLFFQNSLNDFVLSGFEVIALDDGIFPRSIVKKRALYQVIRLKLTAVIYSRCCRITCLTVLILFFLFKTITQQNKCNFVQRQCTGNRDIIARDQSYIFQHRKLMRKSLSHMQENVRYVRKPSLEIFPSRLVNNISRNR